MTLDEIRHQLVTAREVPEAALAAAIEQAEALSPEVLRLIDLACNRVMLTRPEECLLFYGLHVLAAARRTELYDPLLRLTAERSEDFDWLLRDAPLHTLLVSSAGPESKPPYWLLSDPAVDGDAKSDLFQVIAWMAWRGHASREEFIAFLDRFDREASEEPDDMVWYGWQEAIALLGLTELEERVRAGWDAGRMPWDREVDDEAWREALHRAHDAPSDAARFEAADLAPITDLPETLRGILFFGFGDWGDKDAPGDPARDIRLVTDEWEWLGSFLASEAVPLEAMTAERLDGYLTAVAVSPEPVPRAQWWPRIWSESGKEAPEFQTGSLEHYVHELIDRHLETIQRRLQAHYRHVPLVEADSPQENVEEWAIGFSIGLDLSPGKWDRLAEHEHAGLAFGAVAMLLPPEDLAGKVDLPEQTEDVRNGMLDKLPNIIRQIYDFWRGRPVQPLFGPRRVQKIGRNEPCPCGSGRKYKKCCGAN